MYLVYGRDTDVFSEFLKEINEMLKCVNNLYGTVSINPMCPLQVYICSSVIHLHFTSSLLLLQPTGLSLFPWFWHITDKKARDCIPCFFSFLFYFFMLCCSTFFEYFLCFINDFTFPARSFLFYFHFKMLSLYNQFCAPIDRMFHDFKHDNRYSFI